MPVMMMMFAIIIIMIKSPLAILRVCTRFDKGNGYNESFMMIGRSFCSLVEELYLRCRAPWSVCVFMRRKRLDGRESRSLILMHHNLLNILNTFFPSIPINLTLTAVNGSARPELIWINKNHLLDPFFSLCFICLLFVHIIYLCMYIFIEYYKIVELTTSFYLISRLKTFL